MENTPYRSPTLEDAWFKFGEYDYNASLAQKRFLRRRNLITSLGVMATTLAVFYAVIDGKLPVFIDQQAIAKTVVEILARFLRVLIILTPISISILSAIDTKFNLGLSWIVLRSSAEALKKEIYLYRARVSPYDMKPQDSESRDLKLAQRIKAIGQRIMETQVNQSGLDIYQGNLPPYAAEGDDGFSDIGWQEYITWRLEDQFNYYREKSVRLHQDQTRLQWCITIIGGVGTFLAAIRFEIWVAITSAVSAALISVLEFQRIETTLVSCNQASNDLYSIRTWWRALTPEAQMDPHNLCTLVQLTENVIQAENAGWVQEMRDALSDMYGEGESEETAEEKPENGKSAEGAISKAPKTPPPSAQPPQATKQLAKSTKQAAKPANPPASTPTASNPPASNRPASTTSSPTASNPSAS